MSVDYYMGCTKCQEAMHIAQDGLSGFTFYSSDHECMRELGRFLRRHVLCGHGAVMLMSEHEVDPWERVLNSHGFGVPDD